MDLTDPQTVRSLLVKYNVRPNKMMGQYFLTDKEVLWEIVEAAGISSGDAILEIGPGLGVLTVELAGRAKKVVAVEKDRELASILAGVLKSENIQNVELVVGDIMKNGNYAPEGNYEIVANLPYYLTSAVIRKFLETEKPPTAMTLMIQKEVAERICARPPKMNLLAASVQFYGRPEIAAFVSQKSFWPEPEVDSAILHIETFRRKMPPAGVKNFFQILRAGFSSPRKKLANNLAGLPGIPDRRAAEKILKKTGLRPDCRGQDLSVDNWRKLASLIGKSIV